MSRKLEIIHVCSVISDVTGMPVIEIIGRSRERGPVFCRHLVCWYMTRKLGRSYPFVGRVLQRDHSTIIAATQRIDRLVAASDPATLNMMALIDAQLGGMVNAEVDELVRREVEARDHLDSLKNKRRLRPLPPPTSLQSKPPPRIDPNQVRLELYRRAFAREGRDFSTPTRIKDSHHATEDQAGSGRDGRPAESLSSLPARAGAWR